MSAVHLLTVPCLVCDHPEAHRVRVLADDDDYDRHRYAFATPESCPKCKTFYSVTDMMDLSAEIRERVDEHEREYAEHRTGRRRWIA